MNILLGQCPKCRNKGYVKPKYYDEADEIIFYKLGIEGFWAFCDCKYGKKLYNKAYHPVKYYILNNPGIKKIVSLYKRVTNKYFWYDLKYELSKLLNLKNNLFTYFKFILENKNDQSWTLLLITELKIKELEKKLKNDKEKSYDKKWYENKLRRINICLNHLDRYYNIEKHVNGPEYNVWTEPIENSSCFKMVNNATKYQQLKMDSITKLEEWHYKMFWYYVGKYSRDWNS